MGRGPLATSAMNSDASIALAWSRFHSRRNALRASAPNPNSPRGGLVEFVCNAAGSPVLSLMPLAGSCSSHGSQALGRCSSPAGVPATSERSRTPRRYAGPCFPVGQAHRRVGRTGSPSGLVCPGRSIGTNFRAIRGRGAPRLRACPLPFDSVGGGIGYHLSDVPAKQRPHENRHRPKRDDERLDGSDRIERHLGQFWPS